MPYKLGRLPADPSKPKLRLQAGFMSAVLPNPKPKIDYYSQISNWQMYMNDSIGDCTIAQAAHGIMTWTHYAQGAMQSVTDSDVLSAYVAVSGYNPESGANDNGAVLQDVLNYWRRTGVGTHTILAFAALPEKDFTSIHQAVEIFNSVTIGFNFPAFAMDQFNQGKPWDLSSSNGRIDGGHAVNVVGYDADAKTLEVVTWGRTQTMTQAFWTKYVDEAWVVVTNEWLSGAGITPEGLDLYTLGENFASITGEKNPFPAPAPGPTPEPAPSPTPVPAPDLGDQALALVLHKWISKNPWFYKDVQIAAGKWLKSKNL